MKTTLFGMGMGLTIASLGVIVSQVEVKSVSASNPPPVTQSVAQNNGSQAAQTRVVDLGVSKAQLQQMKAIGMRMVMPTTVPTGFRLTDVVSRSDSRFGPSYLLVYRKGSACFGIEGTRGGIGGIPTGDAGSYPIKNAVLGRGQLEQRRSSAEQPQLISQWMGRDPFYRFVGANYSFNGGSELANCQNISVKDAILVADSLRYLDLDQEVVQGLPASTVGVVDANSPTSTVVRYPTQQEFNTFKRSLQAGAFGTVPTISADERRQREAYLTTWNKVNSTGVKFAGAWSDGNRYYYVYPSTVKSRVCVVTLINGKYDFSNGQAISQELRYRNNSFFWIDQPNALAARDNGAGKLYPVFAVQSTPDASAIANFDFGFRNAQCTAELPGMGQNVGGEAR
jgi:hypothetical protein